MTYKEKLQELYLDYHQKQLLYSHAQSDIQELIVKSQSLDKKRLDQKNKLYADFITAFNAHQRLLSHIVKQHKKMRDDYVPEELSLNETETDLAE